MVRRREAPSRTMAAKSVAASSFETPPSAAPQDEAEHGPSLETFAALTPPHVTQILRANENRLIRAAKHHAKGGNHMATSRRTLLKGSAATLAAMSIAPRFASAQAETIRIGTIYDLSGPFAAGGSVASSVGAQIAIDLVNERGG